LLKLKQRVGSLKLIPSSGGVFELTVNGQNIYSKKATGQFPDPDAMVKAVRELNRTGRHAVA
jgi:selenoprotein W-related protein